MAWLAADFSYPTVVAVGDGYHLRPIRAADVDLDYPAVMGSQPRLWSIFGPAWEWPSDSMTYQQDREDLACHEAEIAARESFNYALLDDAETELLGCVYIDPPEKQGADADISWWVVDGQVGTGLERALDALVPRWIAAAWPFTHPRYVGRDLSWARWLALPDLDPPARQDSPRERQDPSGMPTWRRMTGQVWLRRLALVAIAALAGLLYAWAVGRDTLEYYYAAADRSMSISWHDFIFGAFDPAGTITVDKLPGALWLQALSVRAFGMHTWAIILPQVIEGVLTVLVLYRAVARLAGPAAGLIAALVLAVSPATVALNRENISDSLLILLLVLAADAVSGAIAGLTARDTGRDAPLAADDPDAPPDATLADDDPGGPSSGTARGTLGRLILAGLWVGLAFQAKDIEAWMVLPALGLAYLLSGSGPVLRRTGQLAVAGVVVALVSVSWMTAVSLVPAADRPYVDGSHDNSVFAQVFSYNGFTRFGDQTPLQVRAAQLNPGAPIPVPPRVAGRLLDGGLGRDTGWLIPAAVVVAAWGIVSRRRQPRGDPLRACFILWGGWLVTFFVVFSAVTTLWPYYTAALSPAAAAIIGAGVAAARSRGRAPVSWTIGLAVVVAGTATYAAWLVSSAAGAPGWLVPAIVAVGIAATGVIIWALARRRSVPFAAALAAALVAVGLAPAAASVSLAAHSESGFDVPFESARLQEAVALGLGKQGVIAVQAAIPYWQHAGNGTPYLLAAQSALLPSAIIYESGLEALPIGGFDGTNPSPTLAQLQADIRHGLFHLVWISSATDPRLRWVTTHCTQLTKRLYNCVLANTG
jgi:4-amino-4-deoxy-L-arabinose transferase-like glycosyltransferase